MRSRIIFAVEFDWRDEWPEGASESIAVRVILNLRLQFSLRPPESRGKTLVFPFRSFTFPLDSRLASAWSPLQPNVLFYEWKYFANFAVDANFNSRTSIFAESRRKRILMYPGILSAVERTLDFRM